MEIKLKLIQSLRAARRSGAISSGCEDVIVRSCSNRGIEAAGKSEGMETGSKNNFIDRERGGTQAAAGPEDRGDKTIKI